MIALHGDARKSVKDMEALTTENVKLFQKMARRGNIKL